MLLKADTVAGGKGPLLAGQSSLPSLPVPPLEQTFKKYLRTTEPHLSSAEYEATKKAVESALSGSDSKTFGELQKRLQARAADPKQEGNWLAAWWNEAAYMGYRDPVVPYVSYFYAHKDDKNRKTGVSRAASQLKAILAFRKLVESEELTPEKTKAGPMCSASYPWMFNSCRLPVKPVDQATKADPRENNHVVVAHKGHFYEFELVVDGQELSASEIESQLQAVLAENVEAAAKPIGALTSDNRDKWADAREALLAVGNGGGAKNKDALARIESAVIVIALDEAPVRTIEERSWALWWGDGKNRFYDKQQLIVSSNGKSGYMGEHSTMDGTPTLRMNDFVLSALAANKIDLGATGTRDSFPKPKRLQWQLDGNVEARIEDSLKAFEALKAKHDLAILDFQGYGKEAIKKYKCSPDAWVQMVIQLAYFKMFGKPCPTYESAQTRKFKFGRTETIRSASAESLAFVKAMEADGVSDEERAKLFQAAVKQHLTYAKEAADGQGVDRHLFGLKKLLKEGEALPELYKDAAYAKTSNWNLSTSQISSESFDAWGYGEVVPDGFGCAYAIKSNALTFTLTSLKLDAPALRHYINESALELRDLHDRLAAKNSGGAKL
ncbi:acyltransferase ctase cot cpt [Ceraceosorus bombacis]|uniref:Carnitine O-acetyltransferase, mitochondrial n=1 Tax=Ceraceosorus bombacis TaxID=401625 RepID=A0A0P1BHF4_9BASI|nr:acyltransferase ctase cot cpt [Ceraceosorus bombacis]